MRYIPRSSVRYQMANPRRMLARPGASPRVWEAGNPKGTAKKTDKKFLISRPAADKSSQEGKRWDGWPPGPSFAWRWWVAILGNVGTGDVREVELHGRHWPESVGPCRLISQDDRNDLVVLSIS